VPSVPLCFKPLFLNTEAQSPQSCPTGDSRQSIPHSTTLYLSPLPISPLHLFLHLSVPSVPLCFKPLFLNTEAQSPQSCPTGDSRQSTPHSTPLYLSPLPISPSSSFFLLRALCASVFQASFFKHRGTKSTELPYRRLPPIHSALHPSLSFPTPHLPHRSDN
jgi:hypothetical protein